MNIETLNESVLEFRNRVIDSGLKRDVEDYINSLGANQNNILPLRDIASQLREKLNAIHSSDLPDCLEFLFPTEVKPFTSIGTFDKIEALLTDSKVPQNEFYQKLNQLLSELHSQINSNQKEVDRIATFIEPYIAKSQRELSDDEKAILSVVFKDRITTSSLKTFSKTVAAWNRVLPQYQQILSSETPEDIKIVEVQNGSIDLVININADVAVNLVDLFKVGFKCYVAYLSYKHMLKPITESYFGNKKLISQEEDREKELLKNIGLAIEKLAKEQHESASKTLEVTSDNPDKVIEQVTNLVTSHIVKGNDLKLLSLPDFEEGESEDSENDSDPRTELRQASIEARKAVSLLDQGEMKKLLDVYGDIKEER